MKLYGASGHAKVIADIIRACGDRVELLYDDNPEIRSLCGIPVCTPDRVEGPLIISIGNNAIRAKIAARLSHVEFGVAVHPSAVVALSVRVGEGTVIMAGAVVEPETVLGNHCILNTNASVNHECVIGDCVHISPGATLCGDVHVGAGSWICAGAVIVQGIRIGRGCTVGAGAVVLNDLPDGATAVGVPARIIKTDQI